VGGVFSPPAPPPRIIARFVAAVCGMKFLKNRAWIGFIFMHRAGAIEKPVILVGKEEL